MRHGLTRLALQSRRATAIAFNSSLDSRCWSVLKNSRCRRQLRLDVQPCRYVSTEVLTAVLTPPAVFTGLLVTLWTYKCCMMVIFQNKIIYMPSVPPFARSEKVSDYAAQCKPVEWQEHELRSVDGTRLKLLEGRMSEVDDARKQQELVVLYFQGNASSLPPRLPYMSRMLRAIHDGMPSPHTAKVTFVALSYRGYWTSSGSASQPGLELDSEAALAWVLDRFDSNSKIVIWGQSIGTGVATLAAARLIRKDPKRATRLVGLLLETPFVDMRALVLAMYPQKWLPYRYLSPFLRSTWRSLSALEEIGDAQTDMKVLLLQAGNDEIVPDGQARTLEETCETKGMSVERQVVNGALHQDVMMKAPGRKRMVDFIGSFVS